MLRLAEYLLYKDKVYFALIVCHRILFLNNMAGLPPCAGASARIGFGWPKLFHSISQESFSTLPFVQFYSALSVDRLCFAQGRCISHTMIRKDMRLLSLTGLIRVLPLGNFCSLRVTHC